MPPTPAQSFALHTESIISLQTYGVVEALYDSPFYWMAADKTYLDAAFANRGAFTEALVEIARQTRQDGLYHDFTLVFGDGGSGLTVHCGNLPNAAAAERLRHNCEPRKYRQRAGSWFGLVVRADDGLPKFGVNLRFPWKQDDALDEATKGMSLAESPSRAARAFKPGAFKPRKIGRNAPCPCGSGKKFKKCCMP